MGCEISHPLQSQLHEMLKPCQSAWQKLHAGLHDLQDNYSRQKFFYLFAICPRWFKKAGEVPALNEGLDPRRTTIAWSAAQYARLLLLLHLAKRVTESEYSDAMNDLFKTADVNELQLLVQSLNFIPNSDLFVERAREAARSNIESVFCSLAHNSDFAYRTFDTQGWNQLILKAAFLAVPIWSIYGLRERNNTQLVEMLCDYARERQAASRIVPWDLYACPGWLAESEQALSFLKGQFDKGNAKIQQAIVLALSENSQPIAQQLGKELGSQLTALPLSWQIIASADN